MATMLPTWSVVARTLPSWSWWWYSVAVFAGRRAELETGKDVNGSPYYWPARDGASCMTKQPDDDSASRWLRAAEVVAAHDDLPTAWPLPPRGAHLAAKKALKISGADDRCHRPCDGD